MYEGAPYVDEWKPLPPRLHDAADAASAMVVLAAPVAVAAPEVSNAEYAEFLAATDYTPAEPHRFLAHWVDGPPAAGTDEQPVTFVDLDDARAFCAWARRPAADRGRVAARAASPAVPAPGEPAVWNWTETEHSDGRTRFVMLKGGRDYAPRAPTGTSTAGVQHPEFSAKLLLPGLGAWTPSSGSVCVGLPAVGVGCGGGTA